MPYDAHKNFASSAVATAPSPATTGTSLVVSAGDGTKFPTPPFNVTIWPGSAQPSTTNAEIARCTARTTDTLTLTRAQESSTARSIVIGDQIAATITVKTFTDLETAVSYGTTLPASPVDGQEAILVNSTTNPTYQWRFRYNAGSSSAYKWEFIGGSPFHGEILAATNSSATPGIWAGATPVLNLPRAGDYMFTFSTTVIATAQVQLLASIDLNSTNSPFDDAWRAAAAPTIGSEVWLGRANVFGLGLASGIAVNILTWASIASQPFSRRHLSFVPVRVA